MRRHTHLHPVPTRDVHVPRHGARGVVVVFTQPEHGDDAAARVADDRVHDVAVRLGQVLDDRVEVVDVVVESPEVPCPGGLVVPAAERVSTYIQYTGTFDTRHS